MSKPYIIPIVLCLLLTACGGTEASSGGDMATTNVERTEVQSRDRSDDRREDRAGGRSDDRRSRGAQEDPEVRSAVLELSGDEGTGFSGFCTVGEDETEVAGTVPKSLNLDLNGKPLECEIENTGTGPLKADLSVGNSHYIQQTTSRGATLNFTLSCDGYSSSTSSVTAVESETPDAVSNASSYVEAGPSNGE